MHDVNKNYQELLVKLDKQVLISESLEKELKILNEQHSNFYRNQEEKEKQIQKTEQERIEKGILTTEEKLLVEFKNLSKKSEEGDQSLNEIMEKIFVELQANNKLFEENKSTLQTLVSMQESNSKISKQQFDLVFTYGIILIPTVLFLWFMYRFFRQFI